MVTPRKLRGAWNGFLKSTGAPAGVEWSSAFQWLPWWNNTNGCTRWFLRGKRGKWHEAGNCQTILTQPDPDEGPDPVCGGDGSQCGGGEARGRLHHAFPVASSHRTVDYRSGPQPRRIPVRSRPAALSGPDRKSTRLNSSHLGISY